jgi:acyl carrier protein
LTGVVFFSVGNDALDIETMLLSCRVLGRGVEHRVMDWLAREAERRGLPYVTVQFAPSPKNQPARDFLASLGSAPYRFAAPDLRGIRPRVASVPPPATPRTRTSVAHKRPDYESIALRLSTPAQIHLSLRAANVAGKAPAADEPMNETERKLAAIWCDLLKRNSVPLSGNFFDLGGHSLLAVLLIMRVKEAFDVELPIDDVYAAGLTLGDLARRVEAYQLGAAGEYDEILRELEALSDEEVERLLAEEDPGARRA